MQLCLIYSASNVFDSLKWVVLPFSGDLFLGSTAVGLYLFRRPAQSPLYLLRQIFGINVKINIYLTDLSKLYTQILLSNSVCDLKKYQCSHFKDCNFKYLCMSRTLIWCQQITKECQAFLGLTVNAHRQMLHFSY